MSEISTHWPLSEPQAIPPPENRDVHVWCLPLQVAGREFQQLGRYLSDDERERADRFVIDDVRRRYMVGRGRLRCLLGAMLGLSPERVPLRYTGLGKPFLDPALDRTNLHFNLSNSHELALAAFSRGGELGVDVERVRTTSNFMGVAARYFAEQEVARLRALPAAAQLQAFFHGWTRKEALLKAMGVGLTVPLNQVIVTLTPGEPARLLRMGEDAHPAHEIHDLMPATGYVAALALSFRPEQLRCRTWR